jgi:hypothetical protein
MQFGDGWPKQAFGPNPKGPSNQGLTLKLGVPSLREEEAKTINKRRTKALAPGQVPWSWAKMMSTTGECSGEPQ